MKAPWQRHRIDARPINDKATAAGWRDVHRDTDGNVIAYNDQNGPHDLGKTPVNTRVGGGGLGGGGIDGARAPGLDRLDANNQAAWSRRDIQKGTAGEAGDAVMRKGMKPDDYARAQAAAAAAVNNLPKAATPDQIAKAQDAAVKALPKDAKPEQIAKAKQDAANALPKAPTADQIAQARDTAFTSNAGAIYKEANAARAKAQDAEDAHNNEANRLNDLASGKTQKEGQDAMHKFLTSPAWKAQTEEAAARSAGVPTNAESLTKGLPADPTKSQYAAPDLKGTPVTLASAAWKASLPTVGGGKPAPGYDPKGTEDVQDKIRGYFTTNPPSNPAVAAAVKAGVPELPAWQEKRAAADQAIASANKANGGMLKVTGDSGAAQTNALDAARNGGFTGGPNQAYTPESAASARTTGPDPAVAAKIDAARDSATAAFNSATPAGATAAAPAALPTPNNDGSEAPQASIKKPIDEEENTLAATAAWKRDGVAA